MVYSHLTNRIVNEDGGFLIELGGSCPLTLHKKSFVFIVFRVVPGAGLEPARSQ